MEISKEIWNGEIVPTPCYAVQSRLCGSQLWKRTSCSTWTECNFPLVIGTRSVPVLRKLRFLELESTHAPADRQPCKRQLGTPTRPILGDDNNLVSDIKISAFKNEAAYIIGESSGNIVHSVESGLFEMDVHTIYLYLGRYRVIRSLELPVGLSMQGSLSTYHTVAYIVVLRSTHIKLAVQPRIHSSRSGTRMWQSSCGAGLTGICARPRGPCSPT